MWLRRPTRSHAVSAEKLLEPVRVREAGAGQAVLPPCRVRRSSHMPKLVVVLSSPLQVPFQKLEPIRPR